MLHLRDVYILVQVETLKRVVRHKCYRALTGRNVSNVLLLMYQSFRMPCHDISPITKTTITRKMKPKIYLDETNRIYLNVRDKQMSVVKISKSCLTVE